MHGMRSIDDKMSTRGVSVMRGNIAVATVLLLSSTAYSQQSKGGTYVCIAEWAGGGKYDGTKWDSAKFNPDGKFILRLRVVRTYVGVPTFDYYNVTISEIGSKTPFP